MLTTSDTAPLIPPFHAIANTLIGVVIFYMITASGLHYSGAWYSKYLPMSDSSTYDNTGAPYNVTRVITPAFTLNEVAYKEYSPLFMSTTFALSYGLSFASISTLVVYTFLEHGSEIWQRFRGMKVEEPDIHMKMMRKYTEVSNWW